MVLISEVSTADTDDDSHGTSKRAQTYFSSRVQSDDDLDGMHQIGNDQDDVLQYSCLLSFFSSFSFSLFKSSSSFTIGFISQLTWVHGL